MRDLELFGFEFSSDLQSALASQTDLRILAVSGRQLAPVTWKGISKNAKLEFLDLSSIVLDAAELYSLKNLRGLIMTSELIRDNDPGRKDLAKLNQLQQLHENGLSEKEFNNWAKSGALSKLEKLKTGTAVSGKYFPNLRAVELDLTLSVQDDQTILRSYGSSKGLKYFNGGGLEKESWQTIYRFANRNSIESLELSFLTIAFSFGSTVLVTDSDSSNLANFPNLRWAELRGYGTKTLDVSVLKSIEYLDADGVRDLHAVKGIASHPTLRVFKLDSESVQSLGAPDSANQILEYLELDSCTMLTDISSLDTATGLKQVKISRCDALTGPLPFLSSSTPLNISISRNAKLPDQRIER